MATEHAAITDEQAALIESAPLFFVASVDPSLQDRPNGAGPVTSRPRAAFPCTSLTQVVWLPGL